MINILTPDVYNRIAAGEVVDRPYSVVKELVENAVDAGAHTVTIEIEKGGKTLIRVTDDGGGIVKEDLRSAYLPHATSKLRAAEDLDAIRTLGFRGEAIASIASVSKMEIVSKTREGECFSLACEGGVMGEIVPAAGADGTVVTVRDLFYNTPARLKFLKSDGQEEGDVTNMVARFLLSRPEISFTYLVNGKVRYRSFGDGIKSALAVVYGAGILGNCYELDAEKNGIRLHGFVGNTNFSKPNRSYQSLFVCGRYVINQTVSSAVSNAYQSYLMKRQYPFYVLFLDLPPEAVDVNVHPNKADVRFQDNRVVYGAVYSVISAVLDGNSRALDYLASPPEDRTAAFSAAEGRSVPAETDASPVGSAPSAPSVGWAHTDGNTFVPPAPAEARRASAGALQGAYAEAKRSLSFDVTPLRRDERRPQPNFFEVRSPQSAAAERDGEDYFEENRRLLERSGAQKIDVNTLTYKGELFRTYLIYEAGDSAYLIDQHAAHERLLYDKLRARCEGKTAVSQPMLLPYIVSANGQEYAFLAGNLAILRSFGFEIEEYGGSSFKISAVPVDLFGMDLDSFFGEVLASMDTLRAIKLADILKNRLATMACKAAVKGGEQLTEDEVRGLMKEMDGDMGIKCPHGRPACVRIKKTELEKLFKRIV